MRYRHKPTEVEAMQFTEDWRPLFDWLFAELGPTKFAFDVGGTHLVIETTQGDSRDIGRGGWVIKRRINGTADQYEFYPVEPEVMNDYELDEEA